jgi:hypothetical protein
MLKKADERALGLFERKILRASLDLCRIKGSGEEDVILNYSRRSFVWKYKHRKHPNHIII